MNFHKSIVFLAFLALFAGCSKDDGGSDDTGAEPPATDNKSTLTFNTQDSQVFVTTVQLSSIGAASTTGAPGMKTVTFYEPTSKQYTRNQGVIKTTQSGVPLSNLFTIDSSGNLQPVVSSGVNVKVMYTIASPDGDLNNTGTGQSKYLYVVLDPTENGTRQVIANYNCAIFKVTLADGSFTCLDSGYIAQDADQWRNNYSKRIGGGIKPLQFDTAGNVYFLGWPFKVTVEGTHSNLEFDWNSQPSIRKVLADGSGASSITPDVLSIQSYLVTQNDTIVYSYWNQLVGTGGIKIYDLATGSTNELTPDDAGDWWWDAFYLTDDKETVIFGAPNAPGVFFSQRSSGFSGGKYTVRLDTSLFGTGNNSPRPTKVIAGDEGNLYALFAGGGWDSVTQQQKYYVKLHQLLPYDPLAKATLDLPPGTDWWQATNGADVHIRKGYAYFLEKERHPADAYSARTFIKAVNMLNKKEYKMLFGGDWTKERYDIYNWKLVGDIIHFTGFNNAPPGVMILGELNAKLLQQTSGTCLTATDPALKCLAIKEISSVAGSSAQIQDMEAVKVVIPSLDNDIFPRASVVSDSENLYSASVEFTKYMDKDSVNNGISITESGVAQNAMKVWFRQSLHLIFDTDGQVAPATTAPLGYSKTYSIALANDDSIKDIFANPLNCTDLNYSCVASLTTRPELGWWQGSDPVVNQDQMPDAITVGAIGKLAVPYNNNYLKFAELQPEPDGRLEFSLKNRSGGSVNLRLVSRYGYAYSGTDTTVGNTQYYDYDWNFASLYLNNGYLYLSYLKTNNNWGYVDTYETQGYSLPILNGQWAKYVLEWYGTTIKLVVTPEDGAAQTLLEVTDADLHPNSDYVTYYSNPPAAYSYHSGYEDFDVLMNIQSWNGVGSVYYFDNVKYSTLTPAGALVSTVVDEAFTGAPPFNTMLMTVCNSDGMTICFP